MGKLQDDMPTVLTDRKCVVHGICGCGAKVELWVPPTVRCTECKTLYEWSNSAIGLCGPQVMSHLLAQVEDVT